MGKAQLCIGLVGALAITSVNAAAKIALANEHRILHSSLDLERKTQPWCPGDCAVAVAFVASYRNGRERLVFVGVRHTFDPNAPTMRAVVDGFSRFRPAVAIVEGFPTALGENPPELVAQANRYGAADADGFARGEGMLAASIALALRIPFLGGEPTRAEEIQVLKNKGFTDEDLAFSALLGWYSGALRSGEIPDMTTASLMKIYPKLAEYIKAPLEDNGWNLDAPTVAEFNQRYRDLYGVDLASDDHFVLRIDVGDSTRHGQQAQVDMMTRDRHLLGLIEQQLAARKAVLVVYGGSHWSTLSAALEQRLGKPTIRPFLK